MIERLIGAYLVVIQAVVFVCLAVLVALVFGNVVARYVFNSGFPWAYETSRWLFVWMVFLGAIAGLIRNEHIATDLVTSRLPPRVQTALRILCLVIIAWLCWLMIQGSFVQVMINLSVPMPVTGLSNSVFYFACLFFAVSAEFVLAFRLYQEFSGQRG